MAFLETPRFPDAISYGATGGSAYMTDVVIVASGHEQRNQTWSQPRGAWDVSHAARIPADFRTLQSFFHVAKGRLNAFRFKDWSDFVVQAGEGSLEILSPDSTWQMHKRYTAGSSTFDRKIQKPVSGTVTVTGGGGYSVDYVTGIITKTSGANPTGWYGEFDVPARFDTDNMDTEAVSRSGTSLILGWQNIRVVEVRL